MIAYFASIPAHLCQVLSHRLTINKDKESVLFVDEKMYETRGCLDLINRVKKIGLFNDVVPCKMLMFSLRCKSVDELENAILDNYDDFLLKSGYDIHSFEEIYSLNDGWEGEQNIYFNLKHIYYTWLQIAKNYVPNTFPLNEIGRLTANKYKSPGPFAEYAKPCLMESSDETLKLLQGNKDYTTWNIGQCFENIDDTDLNKIFEAFQLQAEEFNYIQSPRTTLLIKNSYGYLTQIIRDYKPVLGFGSYKPSEIFSVMDKTALDFFAPETQTLCVKHHIHDPLDNAETKRIFGENSITMPNVPFEFLGKYFVKNGIKFDKIVGTMSNSLAAISDENYNKFYALGMDFAKCWWFYISIYSALLFAKHQGYGSIFCSKTILSQLKFLSKEMQYEVELLPLDSVPANQIKDSIIINNACERFNFPFEQLDRSAAAVIINIDLIDDFFDASSESFSPIVIEKDRISDVVCDILFREETLWLYSKDNAVKKAARDFTFERDLNNLGMKISSKPITLPQAVNLFEQKAAVMNRYLITEVEQQKKQIELLYEYISSPKSLVSKLKATNDILEYLSILQIVRTKYLVIMAVRDTPGNYLTDDIMQKIFDLGFAKFSKELWKMYVGVSLKTAIICDRSGDLPESPVDYAFKTDTLNVSIVSKAWRQGNQAAIVINGSDHAVNMRGINIVVYDVENDRPVDSIAYDAHVPDKRFSRKKI